MVADRHSHAAYHNKHWWGAFMNVNVDNLEWPWILKYWFNMIFLAIFGCKRVNYNEIDGDRLRLHANRNCYRLSRISWPLLKFLVVRLNRHHFTFIIQQLQQSKKLENKKKCSAFLWNKFFRNPIYYNYIYIYICLWLADETQLLMYSKEVIGCKERSWIQSRMRGTTRALQMSLMSHQLRRQARMNWLMRIIIWMITLMMLMTIM